MTKKTPKAEPDETLAAPAENPAKVPRVTNGDKMAELAAQPDGFTIEEVVAKLGVQRHTARAIISVELRTKRKMNFVLDRKIGRYRIAPAA